MKYNFVVANSPAIPSGVNSGGPMKLILMRHAEAESSQNDFERKLTDQGRLQATRMGDFISNTGWTINDIRHSPLVRARQTADALLFGFGSQNPALIEEGGLAPGCQIASIANIATNYQTGNASIWIMHMPDIAYIVSDLVKIDPATLYLPPGTAIALNMDPANLKNVALIWFLPAELL